MTAMWPEHHICWSELQPCLLLWSH